MSGETVERPHSRLILATLAAFCFTMLAMGLIFVLMAMGISSQQAWITFSIMFAHFLISLFLFIRGQQDRGERRGWKDWLVFAVPSILILRGIAIIQDGSGVDFDETGWFVGSFYALMNLTTLAMILILAGIWQSASFLAHNIEQLHPQQSEIPPSVNSPEYYGWMTSSARWIDRSAAVGRITTAGIFGGAMLTAFTALSAGGFAGGSENAVGDAAPLTVLVFYFVGLLVLHSYSSLVRQTSTWSMQLAQQASGITENWVRSSLLVLGFALLVAMLIPGFRVPESTGLWTRLIQVMFILWQILMLPFVAVIAVLAKLLSLLGTGGSSAEEPAQAPQNVDAGTGQFDDSSLQFLQSAALWVVLIFTAYLIYRRVTSHRPQWKIDKLISVAARALRAAVTAILLGLKSLFELSSEVARLLTIQATARVLQAVGLGRIAPASRTDRPERLSNREQIWRIYLDTLNEAGGAGLERGPNETPNEYQRNLATYLGTERLSVTALTSAFIQARYTLGDVGDGLVASAREGSARISIALQDLR